MDKFIENIVAQPNNVRFLSRKPSQKDRLKFIPVSQPNKQTNTKALTDRPSQMKPISSIQQRKNIQQIINIVLKVLGRNFKLARERAIQLRRNQKLLRLMSLVTQKRKDHLQLLYEKGRERMLRFRRLAKLAHTLSRLFRQSIKLKFSQTLNKIMGKNWKQLNQRTKMLQQNSGKTSFRSLNKLTLTRMLWAIQKLKSNRLMKRMQSKNANRLVRSLATYFKAAKACAMSYIKFFVLYVDNSKKPKTNVLLPLTATVSTETVEQLDTDKELVIKQLALSMDEKTQRILKLEKELASHSTVSNNNNQLHAISKSSVVRHQMPHQHSRSVTPNGLRIHVNSEQSSELDLHEFKMSENKDSSHERSVNSLKSCMSDVRTVFSVNTMNLLKKLEQETNTKNCCKYRAKYQEQHRLTEHLKRKMELMEEEYQMVADINRHFDETLQIQLNPTLASGEVNRFEFDALKKTSERLETQLAKYKAELENTRKQKQKEKTFFKTKLQSIYDKMLKSKKH